MSRGKKLDIFIGAEIEDGWAKVESPRKTSLLNEIIEPSKHFLIFKKEKRLRVKRVDVVAEQVKKVLTNADQQLILMVRS